MKPRDRRPESPRSLPVHVMELNNYPGEGSPIDPQRNQAARHAGALDRKVTPAVIAGASVNSPAGLN